jgi:hypothetical protein
MVEKLTFNPLATALVDCSQHTNCNAPSKLETSVALCCVTELLILKRPFMVPSTRCTCVMIMLFNRLLDMPHLSGGLSWQRRNAH